MLHMIRNHAFAIEFNHTVSSVVSAEAVVAGHLPQTKFTLVLMFSLCSDKKKVILFKNLHLLHYFFLWDTGIIKT